MAFFVSFFSYKGGVGRTLALSNVAHSLAARGKRVFLLDLDLEAPSLHDIQGLVQVRRPTGGAVEYATAYARTGTCPPIGDYVVPGEEISSTGRVWLMPAGRLGQSYQQSLAELNWRQLHPRKGTQPFVEGLRQAIEEQFRPHYVLIDSRTGLSDVAGISTHRMAKMVVVVFNLSRACLEGTVRAYRSMTSESSEVRAVQLVVSPVPPAAPDEGSIVESRLSQARELMPLGTAYGRRLIRIDYHAAMALADDLAVREPEQYPAATRYEALREALQWANPEEIYPLMDEARSLQNEGRIEEAIRILGEFVEDHPADAEGQLALGDFLLGTGRAPAASTAFRKARDLAPDVALVHRRLGEALVAADRSEEAIQALERARDLGEESVTLWIALRDAYAKEGDVERETAAFGRAGAALVKRAGEAGTPRYPREELRSKLDRVVWRNPPSARFDAESFWNDLLGSLGLSSSIKEAILGQIVAGEMATRDLRAVQRLIQEERRRWSEVLGPKASELWERVSGTWTDPQSADAVQELLEGSRRDVPVLLFLGVTGRPDEATALNHLEQAVDLDPDYPWARVALGRALWSHASELPEGPTKLDELERAADLLVGAAPRIDDAHGVYFEAGFILHELANMSEKPDRVAMYRSAIDRYGQALEIKPDKHEALYNWGNALVGLAGLVEDDEEKASCYREAIKRFRQSLDHDPSHERALVAIPAAALSLAAVVDKQERESLYREAEAAAREANRLVPHIADYNLACALSRLGEHEEATELILEECLRRPEIREHALGDEDLESLWKAVPELRPAVEESLARGEDLTAIRDFRSDRARSSRTKA